MMLRFFSLLLVALTLSGCTTTGHTEFPVTPTGQAAVLDQVNIVRLDPLNIAYYAVSDRGHVSTTLPHSTGWDYRVGIGDILDVIVFDHPELTLPAGPERSAVETGYRVQSDGTFFYPFVGQIRASGMSVEQIREVLTQRLAEFIPNPQLQVRVAEFNSQRVVVAGEVRQPNRQPLTTVPLTLIEAINAAGGLNDIADARRVTVQRGGNTYRVDLDAFLKAGVQQNNPVLRSGDVVSVPRRDTQEAFILGQVMSPGTVDLSRDAVSLTQALTRQGGVNELRADARGVFVFRIVDGYMTVYQLEITTPAGLLLGTRFVLEPQDVVYVTRSPLQRWNDTISSLLPTVQAVRTVQVTAHNL